MKIDRCQGCGNKNNVSGLNFCGYRHWKEWEDQSEFNSNDCLDFYSPTKINSDNSKIAPTISLIIIVFTLVSFLILATLLESKCLGSSKVVSIDSIFYRGGSVTLENGWRGDINGQGDITVGYDYCLKRATVWRDWRF